MTHINVAYEDEKWDFRQKEYESLISLFGGSMAGASYLSANFSSNPSYNTGQNSNNNCMGMLMYVKNYKKTALDANVGMGDNDIHYEFVEFIKMAASIHRMIDAPTKNGHAKYGWQYGGNGKRGLIGTIDDIEEWMKDYSLSPEMLYSMWNIESIDKTRLDEIFSYLKLWDEDYPIFKLYNYNVLRLICYIYAFASNINISLNEILNRLTKSIQYAILKMNDVQGIIEINSIHEYKNIVYEIAKIFVNDLGMKQYIIENRGKGFVIQQKDRLINYEVINGEIYEVIKHINDKVNEIANTLQQANNITDALNSNIPNPNDILAWFEKDCPNSILEMEYGSGGGRISNLIATLGIGQYKNTAELKNLLKIINGLCLALIAANEDKISTNNPNKFFVELLKIAMFPEEIFKLYNIKLSDEELNNIASIFIKGYNLDSIYKFKINGFDDILNKFGSFELRKIFKSFNTRNNVANDIANEIYKIRGESRNYDYTLIRDNKYAKAVFENIFLKWKDLPSVAREFCRKQIHVFIKHDINQQNWHPVDLDTDDLPNLNSNMADRGMIRLNFAKTDDNSSTIFANTIPQVPGGSKIFEKNIANKINEIRSNSPDSLKKLYIQIYENGSDKIVNIMPDFNIDRIKFIKNFLLDVQYAEMRVVNMINGQIFDRDKEGRLFKILSDGKKEYVTIEQISQNTCLGSGLNPGNDEGKKCSEVFALCIAKGDVNSMLECLSAKKLENINLYHLAGKELNLHPFAIPQIMKAFDIETIISNGLVVPVSFDQWSNHFENTITKGNKDVKLIRANDSLRNYVRGVIDFLNKNPSILNKNVRSDALNPRFFGGSAQSLHERNGIVISAFNRMKEIASNYTNNLTNINEFGAKNRNDSYIEFSQITIVIIQQLKNSGITIDRELMAKIEELKKIMQKSEETTKTYFVIYDKFQTMMKFLLGKGIEIAKNHNGEINLENVLNDKTMLQWLANNAKNLETDLIKAGNHDKMLEILKLMEPYIRTYFAKNKQ